MKDKSKQRIVNTRAFGSWYARNSDRVNLERREARRKLRETTQRAKVGK
jgi:hypothetical protein